MPDTTSPRFESVTPRLPVGDLEKTLIFYVEQLGFELGWKWGSPPTHANVCRGNVSLDLIHVPDDHQGTAMAYIQIAGVDAYFAELSLKNVDATAVENRPYGMRDFEVVDPSGNRIAFGQPLEP